jgi:ribosomal protein S18 acetylase RimI-like enzyme
LLSFDFISNEYSKEIEAFHFNKTVDEMNVEKFFKEQALHLHQLQTVVTRLYFNESDQLVGFFSLHNDLISLMPTQINRFGWELPTEGQSHYPAIKLHYLGVDSRYRNQGIGKHMLNEAISIASEVTALSGCNFLSVEALGSSVNFYNNCTCSKSVP